MIVLANEEFATGLRLAGVKDSHIVHSKEEGEKILEKIPKNEFIIATQKVIDMLPKLSEYPNITIFPDTISDFSKVDDLKNITKTAIGSEVVLS